MRQGVTCDRPRSTNSDDGTGTAATELCADCIEQGASTPLAATAETP